MVKENRKINVWVNGEQTERSVKGEHWYNQMMQEKASEKLGIPTEREMNVVFAVVCFVIAGVIIFLAILFNAFAN